MITYELGKKVYKCDICECEVWSLICWFLDGKWCEFCDKCNEEMLVHDV